MCIPPLSASGTCSIITFPVMSRKGHICCTCESPYIRVWVEEVDISQTEADLYFDRINHGESSDANHCLWSVADIGQHVTKQGKFTLNLRHYGKRSVGYNKRILAFEPYGF